MADGARVIEMKNQIVCTNCVHHLEGPLGLFCGLYREEVAFNEVALECEDFEHGF